MEKIGAVILAAGSSSRIRQPKQLLSLRGKTFVRACIETAAEAGCSPVAVVVGSDSEKIHPELADTNAIEVQNPNWQHGIGSSIRCGVKALLDQTPDVNAILLLVCDQPALNAHLIEGLIAARDATKKQIVASSYADTIGVPALFDRFVFEELLSLHDEAGAKSIILQKPERVAQLSFPDGAIDVDTWEDWQKAQQKHLS